MGNQFIGSRFIQYSIPAIPMAVMFSSEQS